MNPGCRKACWLTFCLSLFASITDLDVKISFFNTHPSIKGALSIDKLSCVGLSYEEHLIFMVLMEDSTIMDEDIINSMLELSVEIICECPTEPAELIQQRKRKE